MSNYDVEEERLQPPYLYGVGKVYEVECGDAKFLVKSNTEFVRDDLIGTTPVSHYREVGNVFVSDFKLMENRKREYVELNLTWLDKNDYVALKYCPEYEKVHAIVMNIDNLCGSYFPYKQTGVLAESFPYKLYGSDKLTLVVNGDNTKMSPLKQIRTLKTFIETSGGPFDKVKLVGFPHYIEEVLSRKSEKELKSIHGQQKQKSLEL